MRRIGSLIREYARTIAKKHAQEPNLSQRREYKETRVMVVNTPRTAKNLSKSIVPSMYGSRANGLRKLQSGQEPPTPLNNQ